MDKENNEKQNFMEIYNKANRLAAAIFVVSNIINNDEELKTKIKNLSLELVSLSVNLKDTNFTITRNTIFNLEKKSLELMSFLDIASMSELISKMNGNILKEEFKSFILELNKFSEKFEISKTASVNDVFNSFHAFNSETREMLPVATAYGLQKNLYQNQENSDLKNVSQTIVTNANGHNRKDNRRKAILEFIKGHNNANIKDIIPNITGCSEKTVQRELIVLIKEGKIKKIGERRWSRYIIA
jgi:hypothetical protein